MIGIKLDGFIYDSRTKTLYFENESDFEAARAVFLAAGPAARRGSQETPIPALRVLTGGQVFIKGTELKFTPRRRAFLKTISDGGGRCSRLDALNAVYTQAEQMKMKRGPDRAIQDMRDNINKMLAPYKVFIGITRTEFYLQEY